MNGNDLLPKTVCPRCTNRIQVFDQFCSEVEHNQYLLQLSQLKGVNDGARTIAASNNQFQLSPEVVSKGSNNLIKSDEPTEGIKNSASGTVIRKSQIPCSEAPPIEVIDESTQNETSINSNSIERELDDLATDDVMVEVHSESDNEDVSQSKVENAIDNDLTITDIDFDAKHGKYKDFPTKIIDGCKLLYRGRDLLEMISRFYDLTCDRCQ